MSQFLQCIMREITQGEDGISGANEVTITITVAEQRTRRTMKRQENLKEGKERHTQSTASDLLAFVCFVLSDHLTQL